MEQFMVLVGPSGAVFVKGLEFFRSQGGDKKDWGKHWYGPIEAESVEAARKMACETRPGAKPYSQQCKP